MWTSLGNIEMFEAWVGKIWEIRYDLFLFWALRLVFSRLRFKQVGDALKCLFWAAYASLKSLIEFETERVDLSGIKECDVYALLLWTKNPWFKKYVSILKGDFFSRHRYSYGLGNILP